MTAQLIDAATEEHIWSDNYDRQLDDVFSIQSEIAKSVSEVLLVRLVPEDRATIEREATSNPTALVHYLKGRVAMRGRSEENLKEARKFFEEAIADDPTYAEAYTGLADALSLLANYGFVPAAEAVLQGKEAVDKALSINPDLPEAHTSLANYLQGEFMFVEAEREFQRAIELNRNYVLAHHWYAILLLEAGRTEEALKQVMTAEDLDPLSPVFAYNATLVYARVGNDAASQKYLARLKELDPVGGLFESALSYRSSLNEDLEGTAAHAERGLEKNPKDALMVAILGLVSAKIGKREKAMEALARLQALPENTSGKRYLMALVYGGLGDREEMFRYLDLAFKERSINFRVLRYWYVLIDPDIRNDERFAALFRRAGLNPPSWLSPDRPGPRMAFAPKPYSREFEGGEKSWTCR